MEAYDDQRTKGEMYAESFKVRNKPFKCVVCALSYSSQGALLNHKRGKHEGVLYNCEIRDCNFSASQAGNLRQSFWSDFSERKGWPKTTQGWRPESAAL